MSIIPFSTMFLSLVLLIFFRLAHSAYWVLFFKTITTLCCLTTAICASKEASNKNKTYTLFILLAFIGCTLGDITLAIPQGGIFFIVGVVSFSLAHISYICAFFTFGPIKKSNVILAFVAATIALTTVNFFPNFCFGSLIPAINAYCIIISIMVGKSISILIHKELNKKLVTLTLFGVFAFYVSDYILLFALFLPDKPLSLQIANDIVYFTAQAIIGLSLKYQN